MNRLVLSAMALCSSLTIATNAFAFPSVFPSGTTIYDPEQAYNGYVLVSSDYKNAFTYAGKEIHEFEGTLKVNSLPPRLTSDSVKLIDMNGNIINEWSEKGSNKRSILLPNGNLLSISEEEKEVKEYDWEGNVVWRYHTDLGPHHAVQRLENGNTLILCFETLPEEFDAQVKNHESRFYGLQDRENIELRGDSIIEVNPEGEVVWSWLSSDHLDVNTYMPTQPLKDWTHGNTIFLIPENKWYDAGDERFKPGNIIFNPRHFNQFFIISKETGEIVWESPKDFKMFGGFANPHEMYMIPKGYPGAGNFMVFDNGLSGFRLTHDQHSIIWEIQPDTFEVVWRYLAVPGRFLSKVMGAAYKLPNGNVLISEDTGGRSFQVVPDMTHPDGGRIVWEYQNIHQTCRTSIYPYDHTPQLVELGKPEENKVSPLHPVYFQVLPDKDRKDGITTTYTPQ